MFFVLISNSYDPPICTLGVVSAPNATPKATPDTTPDRKRWFFPDLKVKFFRSDFSDAVLQYLVDEVLCYVFFRGSQLETAQKSSTYCGLEDLSI